MKKIKRRNLVIIAALLAFAYAVVLWKSKTAEPSLPQTPQVNHITEAQIPTPEGKTPTPPPPQKQNMASAQLAPPPSQIIIKAPTPEPKKEPENRNRILCEHIVSGENQYEFTGQIRLINKGSETIYGWAVEWNYPDGSTLFDSSEVALAGNNPYTGEYLDTNAEIAPGKTVVFYFTGMKGGESSPRDVKVTGDFCM